MPLLRRMRCIRTYPTTRRSMARHGFTLLEIILVVVVLGVITGVVLARLGGSRDAQIVRNQAIMIVSQAQRARQLATAEYAAVRLRIAPAGATLAVEVLDSTGMRAPHDGHGVENNLSDDDRTTVALGDVTSNESLDLLFLPDGRCDTPGLIRLARGKAIEHIRIPVGARGIHRVTETDTAAEENP